jgi:hypothetical protein
VELLGRLTSWSYRRQLLGRVGPAPLEALRTVVAVYSTHPTAPLALLARSRLLEPGEFRALEQQRQTIRIVGMRGSAFLVPAESAACIVAATRLPTDRLGARLRYGGLDFDAYARLAPMVLECCNKPLTPAELRACAGVADDVYLVARVLAREARMLRVGASLRTNQLKYVAAAAWLGHPLKEVDAGEARAWLARQYLRAFGPARVVDFAWWAGLPRREASAALASLDTVERDGLLLLDEDVDAFDATEPIEPDRVDVLPKWDSYSMGYASDGRQRFIDDRFLSLAYTSVTRSPGATSGDGLPLILKGGRAIGTWSHRFSGSRPSVTVTPFPGNTCDASFEAIAQLLDATAVEVISLDSAQ